MAATNRLPPMHLHLQKQLAAWDESKGDELPQEEYISTLVTIATKLVRAHSRFTTSNSDSILLISSTLSAMTTSSPTIASARTLLSAYDLASPT